MDSSRTGPEIQPRRLRREFDEIIMETAAEGMQRILDAGGSAETAEQAVGDAVRQANRNRYSVSLVRRKRSSRSTNDVERER